MKKPNFSNNQLDELTKRIAGTTDRLEAASSLTGPLVWTSVASATADLDGTFQLRNTPPGTLANIDKSETEVREFLHKSGVVYFSERRSLESEWERVEFEASV